MSFDDLPEDQAMLLETVLNYVKHLMRLMDEQNNRIFLLENRVANLEDEHGKH